MKSPHNIIAHSVRDVLSVAEAQPGRFVFLWFGGVFVLFGLLAAFGFLPPALLGETVETASATSTETVAQGPSIPHALTATSATEPVRIIIDKIDIDTTVANPESTDVNVLDQALLGGAVRYPGSADLSDDGNMFLFGHSSYLPRVINPAFKAFNGLQNLVAGDVIRVQSADKEYIYRVDTVSLVDANDAWVDLSGVEKRLTLSTCNTFGQKQDRFVVEAYFVGSYML